MEQSGNIPVFNIPGTLFWNIPLNFIGNFFPNILGISHGSVSQIFHKHIFVRWGLFPGRPVIFTFAYCRILSTNLITSVIW